MKERYLTKNAVFMIIENQDQQILFQRRKNTGYMDGFLDLGASGHVESGETAKQAALRELTEEINLKVEDDRLTFVAINHRNTEGDIYYDFYFYVQVTDEEKAKIKINEEEKVSELKWLIKEALTEDIIEYNRIILEGIKQGVQYFEYGW